MKLRLDGRSVRLRVTSEEIAALSVSGEVAVATIFPGGSRFVFRLRAGAPEPRVSFVGDALTVSLDDASVATLRDGPEGGVYHEAEVPGAARLRFYVERDRTLGRPTER